MSAISFVITAIVVVGMIVINAYVFWIYLSAMVRGISDSFKGKSEVPETLFPISGEGA